MKRFFFAPTVLVLAMVLPACAAGNEPEFDDSVDESALEEENKAPLAASGRSGLSPVCFWSDNTQMTLRLYGAQSLVENGVLRPPHILSSACSDVPAYVVRCALPEGTIVKTASGTEYEGQFGLAPNWTSAKLSSDEQRWVTGCLLQHLSDEDNVPMELAGSSPALGNMEQAFQGESIATGNLFTGGTAPVGEAAFQAYACIDTGLVNACDGNAESALIQRMCGTSAKCGINVLGSCADQCEFDANGRVVSCFDDDARELVRMRVDSDAITALHGDVCQ